MTELEVRVDTWRDRAVLSVQGKIMFDTQEPLGDALKGALLTSVPRIVVDLHEVTICDSTGLQLFVGAHRQSVAAGGWLRLCRPQPLVQRVLEITNLVEVLPIHPSVEAAVSAPDMSGSDAHSGDPTV